MDAWLNALSDEERAGVMKVQIAETEATKRKAIEEEEHTKRDLFGNDVYHVVRFIVSVCVLVSIIGIVAMGCQAIETWGKIKGTAPASPISSSAKPASS